MVKQMDEEGFGNCTNTGACEAECPKNISLENIARMNREYMGASWTQSMKYNDKKLLRYAAFFSHGKLLNEQLADY